MVSLCCEQDAMAGFFVNFNLRVVWAHVALRTRAGKPRDGHRAGMPGMAWSAVADCAIGIGLTNGVTLSAATCNCCAPLEMRECVWRPLHVAGIELLGKADLLGRKT